MERVLWGEEEMKHSTLIVRLVLSTILIYFSYKETGPCTAVILVLVLISMEITSNMLSKK